MPRYYDNGAFFTVSLSESDVIEWAQRWPCFVTRRRVWFQFDKKNGDLVDMSDTEGMDESGILALSHDAQAWGEDRAQRKQTKFCSEYALRSVGV